MRETTIINLDHRHKCYGFPEVFEQPKSISLSERFRASAELVSGREGGACHPRLMTLPPNYQLVPAGMLTHPLRSPEE